MIVGNTAHCSHFMVWCNRPASKFGRQRTRVAPATLSSGSVLSISVMNTGSKTIAPEGFVVLNTTSRWPKVGRVFMRMHRAKGNDQL